MKIKQAFTLAELLIVLTVLAIISVTIIPAIVSNRPDESLLRFKKAYFTLQRTVEGVLNSDAYPTGDLAHPVGDLNVGGAVPADGAIIPFCYHFSQMLNTTEEDCRANTVGMYVYADQSGQTTAALMAGLDARCDDDSATQIITQDGNRWSGMNCDFSTGEATDDDGFRRDYCPICVDVDDGEVGPMLPIAFGVRNDGKIVLGACAQCLLNRESAEFRGRNEDGEALIEECAMCYER